MYILKDEFIKKINNLEYWSKNELISESLLNKETLWKIRRSELVRLSTAEKLTIWLNRFFEEKKSITDYFIKGKNLYLKEEFIEHIKDIKHWKKEEFYKTVGVASQTIKKLIKPTPIRFDSVGKITTGLNTYYWLNENYLYFFELKD